MNQEFHSETENPRSGGIQPSLEGGEGGENALLNRLLFGSES
jgi:hypothetical protein